MKRMVEQNGQLELIGAYTNVNEALEEIIRLLPDVVFADVEMPAVNGMELAEKIKSQDESIQVVFVTAHEKYALQAFRVNAVNYILKPITEEELSITVNRLVKGYESRMHSRMQENRKRITAFGGLEVYGDRANEPVRWPTAKVRELFACFVLNRGNALDKWQLCERLWPLSSPKKAEHSLHSAVNRMKVSLREAGIINSLLCEKGRYRINLSDFSCDVWELTAFAESNPFVNDENISRFERALALYRGDLFGLDDYAWCIEYREKLRTLFLTGAKNVGRYFLEKQSYEQAEKSLQQSIESDPFDEEAVSLLLKVYFLSGSKEKLVDSYDKLKHTLREELGIVPRAETARLYNDLVNNM